MIIPGRESAAKCVAELRLHETRLRGHLDAIMRSAMEETLAAPILPTAHREAPSWAFIHDIVLMNIISNPCGRNHL